jgi:hypothetical protein
MKLLLKYVMMLFTGFIGSCKVQQSTITKEYTDAAHGFMAVPERFKDSDNKAQTGIYNGNTSFAGTVLIPGCRYMMRGDNDHAKAALIPA